MIVNIPSVSALPSKKQGPSRKRGLLVFALALALVVIIILFATNFGSNVYRIAQPAASSFEATEWMGFLPSDAVAFRFLNISALVMVPGLFNSSTLVNLDPIGMNLTAYDVGYGVEIYTLNGSYVHVMTMNESILETIESSLASQPLPRVTSGDVEIYYLQTHPTSGEGGSWLCIDKGAMIFSGPKDSDLISVMKVISANATTFFNSDVLKIGYLLTSNGKVNPIFSYYAWQINSNDVDMEMRSVTNSSPSLEVRTAYHFLTQSDFDQGYDYFLKNILSSARTIYVSPTFLIGQYVYSQEVWNSLISAL